MTATPTAGRKRKTTDSTPRRSGPRKTASDTRTSAGRGRTGRAAKAPAKQPAEEHEAGPHVHMAHPQVPIPYMTRKDLSATMRTAGSAMPTLPASKLPSRDQLALYGGLGVLAAFGAVDWPVAAAIGVATAVARRGRNGKN